MSHIFSQDRTQPPDLSQDLTPAPNTSIWQDGLAQGSLNPNTAGEEIFQAGLHVLIPSADHRKHRLQYKSKPSINCILTVKGKLSLKSLQSQIRRRDRACSVSQGTALGPTGGGQKRAKSPSDTEECCHKQNGPQRNGNVLGRAGFLVTGGFHQEGCNRQGSQRTFHALERNCFDLVTSELTLSIYSSGKGMSLSICK